MLSHIFVFRTKTEFAALSHGNAFLFSAKFSTFGRMRVVGANPLAGFVRDLEILEVITCNHPEIHQ